MESLHAWVAATDELSGSCTFLRDEVHNPVTGAKLKLLSADVPGSLGLRPTAVRHRSLARGPALPPGSALPGGPRGVHRLPALR
jgi:hypothetical protein